MLSRFWTRALLEGNLLIPQDLLQAYQSCVKESLCVARHKKKYDSYFRPELRLPIDFNRKDSSNLYIMVSKLQTNSCKDMCRYSKPVPTNYQVP